MREKYEEVLCLKFQCEVVGGAGSSVAKRRKEMLAKRGPALHEGLDRPRLSSSAKRGPVRQKN